MKKTLVKFKIGHLSQLRKYLLRDMSREWFGMAMGNMENIGNTVAITVKRIKVFNESECEHQSIVHVRPTQEAVKRELIIAQQRYYNVILDVHSHPFAVKDTQFSETDTNDERRFASFLHKKIGRIDTYGSIVFSKDMYNGRMWLINNKQLNTPSPLEIRVPVYTDAIAPCHDIPWLTKPEYKVDYFGENGLLNRNYQALGKDVMERIVDSQKLVVVGAGSISSIFTASAAQSGFNNFVLVDFDRVEHSNLSRLEGATFKDAERKAKKVAVLKRLIHDKNPKAQVKTYDTNILTPPQKLLEEIADANWLIIGTDNASSRFECVKLAMRFHTSYISMGVNVSVENEKVSDTSGEVITARPGDNICHLCLGRINHTQIAHENHPDEYIRQQLLARGYVRGKDVKNPMVKTVNSIVSNIALDVLINQYSFRQEHHAIWVYENNRSFEIYADKDSVTNRKRNCALCSV